MVSDFGFAQSSRARSRSQRTQNRWRDRVDFRLPQLKRICVHFRRIRINSKLHRSHSPTITTPSQKDPIDFLNSAPTPRSILNYRSEHGSGNSFRCHDICADTNRLSPAIIKCRHDVSGTNHIRSAVVGCVRVASASSNFAKANIAFIKK